MRLYATDAMEDASWDATVAAFGGTVFHSSTYARYVVTAERNAVPLFLTVRDCKGIMAGAALGFRTQSPHRLLSALSSRMWLAALPALGGDSRVTLAEFLLVLEDFARCCGIMVLDLHSSASCGGSETLQKCGYALTERWEFEVNLLRSEAELWEAMESKRRAKIKKAMRLGVSVRELPSDQGISELRRLQEQSSRRIVARGGPNIAANRSRREDPLVQLADGRVGRIIGASVDGKVVSAGLFTYFNGLVYHTLSGHSEAALRSQAPTMLLWETIKWYRNSGATRFNLGGCSRDAVDNAHPENGVYVYKMGFGAQRIECTSGRKVLRPRLYTLRESIKRILRR